MLKTILSDKSKYFGNRIIQKFSTLTRLLIIPDYYWALKLNKDFIETSKNTKIDYNTINGNLFLKDFGITLSKNNRHDFFIESLDMASSLLKNKGASFQVVNNQIMVTIDDIKVNINSREELFILHEIFAEGIYNVAFPKSTIVIDIGMNVGFASLFFAKLPNVFSVLAYEPLTRTFEDGKLNFILNPELSSKIRRFNFGLGDTDAKVFVDYCYEHKGRTGINGMPDWIKGSHKEISRESIKLVDVNVILEQILNDFKNEDVNFAAKIDCEGSEYQLIEALYKSGKLKYFNFLIIEWHDVSKNSKLITQLIEFGFNVVWHKPSSSVGMLYASRCD